MKKYLFSFAFLCISLTAVNAQVIVQDKTTSGGGGSSGDIRFGAKAGLNISTFVNRGFFDITPNVGAFIGGVVEIPITDQIYGQPELLISFQGANLGLSNLNLLYAHLPLMGKYHITEEFAAEIGPQVSFVLADNAGDFANDDLTERQSNRVQLALNLGGGYRLNDNLYFQARFSLGLTKTVKELNFRNGVVQLGAAYIF